MKALLLTVLASLALNATASDFNHVPEYYAPEFKIIDVSPMCPRTIPNGAQCMGLGSIVKISTTLGCLDTLEFQKIKTIANGRADGVELHSVALALRHPDSARVRCARANTIVKTIIVQEMGTVEIINSEIKN